jgi:hypothetical protein
LLAAAFIARLALMEEIGVGVPQDVHGTKPLIQILFFERLPSCFIQWVDYSRDVPAVFG